MELQFIPKSAFKKINESNLNKGQKLSLLAKMCRLNTLFEVKKAGSGHLGSSFSAMDIVVYLYYHYLNIKNIGIDNPDRDIYFSSKGHDVPGLYAVLYSLGIIMEEKFLKLRRLGGLDGHPDINIPGIEANSGSLGMGISKGRGIMYAKNFLKRKGKVIILTGDGEFQEGQNFEALQATVHQQINNLIVIIDHNKIQSDRPVEKIIRLGNLEEKFKSFGWYVARCNGHDYIQIETKLKEFEQIHDKPKILICDTIKGKGISFMEHPEALKTGNGFYQWHAGAPDDESYEKGFNELLTSIKEDYEKYNLDSLELLQCPTEIKSSFKTSDEYVSVAYGKALFEQAQTNQNFVVLDADLAGDCKIKDFERVFPQRFIECGIAEQDMVSMAGGIALQGLIPVVNSFAGFLSSRSNEQIYNNLTEEKKIIYACHYAGLIPAGPGKSHQSLRDISLFGAIPNCTILQAANSDEMKMIVNYAINESKESCMLRINIGPSPVIIELPSDYTLKFGCGVKITEGKHFVLVAYGPVMLHEALIAQKTLIEKGIQLKVINMPWLNRFDLNWFNKELDGCKYLFILEDHDEFGGLGDNLINFLNENNLLCGFKIKKFAVQGFPACGTPQEVLKYHKLDGNSIAEQIAAFYE